MCQATSGNLDVLHGQCRETEEKGLKLPEAPHGKHSLAFSGCGPKFCAWGQPARGCRGVARNSPHDGDDRATMRPWSPIGPGPPWRTRARRATPGPDRPAPAGPALRPSFFPPAPPGSLLKARPGQTGGEDRRGERGASERTMGH
eukprot:15464331-Alexandrium_andersonii.AAC.1